MALVASEALADMQANLVRVKLSYTAGSESIYEEFVAHYIDVICIGREYFIMFRMEDGTRRQIRSSSVIEFSEIPKV